MKRNHGISALHTFKRENDQLLSHWNFTFLLSSLSLSTYSVPNSLRGCELDMDVSENQTVLRVWGVCVCVWVCVCVYSHIQLFMTPWPIAHRAPLSMEFSKQEYWSLLPFPPLGDLPDQTASPASVGRLFTTEPPGKPHSWLMIRDKHTINQNPVTFIHSTSLREW